MAEEVKEMRGDENNKKVIFEDIGWQFEFEYNLEQELLCIYPGKIQKLKEEVPELEGNPLGEEFRCFVGASDRADFSLEKGRFVHYDPEKDAFV